MKSTMALQRTLVKLPLQPFSKRNRLLDVDRTGKKSPSASQCRETIIPRDRSSTTHAFAGFPQKLGCDGFNFEEKNYSEFRVEASRDVPVPRMHDKEREQCSCPLITISSVLSTRR